MLRIITKSQSFSNPYFYRFLFFFSQMKIIFPYPPLHQLSTFIYRSYKYKDRIKFHPQFLKNLSSPITTPKQISFIHLLKILFILFFSQNFLYSQFPRLLLLYELTIHNKILSTHTHTHAHSYS